MAQPRRCTFCGGGKVLAVEWAYLPAGQTRLATVTLDVRCKWCRGAERTAVSPIRFVDH